MAGPAFEGLAQPLAEVLGESWRVVRRREVQPPVRRECRGEGGTVRHIR